MVLVDDVREIVVSEYLIEDTPVFDHAFADPKDELSVFLDRIGFPDHALIVKGADAGLAAGFWISGPNPSTERVSKCLRAQAHIRSPRTLAAPSFRILRTGFRRTGPFLTTACKAKPYAGSSPRIRQN
ncbi:hypothetical protein [Pseudaminobacter sp. NGMCC 1.201702]|uniref:hypothetical protein n=1 Tax=Pseudaminobacter sp. NGMCC 1.201702 TaxID=3391825 RepID=UPI0039EE3380